MIRLFNVYIPVRTLVLLIGEALIVWTSFLLGAVYELREDSYLVLNYEGGYLKQERGPDDQGLSDQQDQSSNWNIDIEEPDQLGLGSNPSRY